MEVTVGAEGSVLVEDAGPGVPEHERQLVFRRFWRARRRADPKRRGAGLGLSIVQRAAELHRGGVSIGTGRHGGAAFRLSIPPLRTAPPPQAAGGRSSR